MIKDDIIAFGNHNWLILEWDDNRKLVITKDIIELRWYHTEFVDVTWRESEIRKYLNTDFYDMFNQHEKEKIIPVVNRNPDNPWFGTKGGADTMDKIFLLSLEEVCRYFGDSGKKLLNRDGQKWHIEDENNRKRQAVYNNKPQWWRLRSPGYYSRTSASISSNGNVYVRGNGVHGSPKDGGGVRPAMWLTLEV